MSTDRRATHFMKWSTLLELCNVGKGINFLGFNRPLPLNSTRPNYSWSTTNSTLQIQLLANHLIIRVVSVVMAAESRLCQTCLCPKIGQLP